MQAVKKSSSLKFRSFNVYLRLGDILIQVGRKPRRVLGGRFDGGSRFHAVYPVRPERTPTRETPVQRPRDTHHYKSLYAITSKFWVEKGQGDRMRPDREGEAGLMKTRVLLQGSCSSRFCCAV